MCLAMLISSRGIMMVSFVAKMIWETGKCEPKLIFRDFKANHFIKSGRNWMFKTFKANHFNISEQKRIFKSFEGEITFKCEFGQKVNVENFDVKSV